MKAQEREREKSLKAQQVAERKVERQKNAEQKRAALTARIASPAVAKSARAALHRSEMFKRAFRKKPTGQRKQLANVLTAAGRRECNVNCSKKQLEDS